MAEMIDGELKGKWWQWPIIYPQFFVYSASIVAGLLYLLFPGLRDYYDALSHGATFGTIGSSLESRDSFAENAKCFDNLQLNEVPNSDDADISVGVCKSKALVVFIHPKDKPATQPVIRFVTWSDVDVGRTSSLFSSAYAGELPAEMPSSIVVAQAGPAVLCQKPLDGGLIQLRIKDANGQCFDQAVNTFTGAVVNSVPAQCDPSCR